MRRPNRSFRRFSFCLTAATVGSEIRLHIGPLAIKTRRKPHRYSDWRIYYWTWLTNASCDLVSKTEKEAKMAVKNIDLLLARASSFKTTLATIDNQSKKSPVTKHLGEGFNRL